MDRDLFVFGLLVCGLCAVLLMSTCPDAFEPPTAKPLSAKLPTESFEPAPLKIYERDLGVRMVDGKRVRLFESRDASGNLMGSWTMPADD